MFYCMYIIFYLFIYQWALGFLPCFSYCSGLVTSCVPLFVTPWTIASVHGISQARIQKWVAISLPRGSSWPWGGKWDPTQVSCFAGSFFTDRATKDIPLAIVSSVVKNIVVTISFFFLHILRNRIAGSSLIAQLVKNLPAIQKTLIGSGRSPG